MPSKGGARRAHTPPQASCSPPRPAAARTGTSVQTPLTQANYDVKYNLEARKHDTPEGRSKTAPSDVLGVVKTTPNHKFANSCQIRKLNTHRTKFGHGTDANIAQRSHTFASIPVQSHLTN